LELGRRLFATRLHDRDTCPPARGHNPPLHGYSRLSATGARNCGQLSRLIAKDKVTAFLRAFHAGLLFAPRATRVVASTLTALPDFLQIAYKAAEDRGLGGS
jgi:hypothetical protein